MTIRQLEILSFIRQNRDLLIRDVAAFYSADCRNPRRNFTKTIARMHRAGYLIRTGRGRYQTNTPPFLSDNRRDATAEPFCLEMQ